METMQMIMKIMLASLFALAILSKLAGKSKDTFEKSYGVTSMYVVAFLEMIFSIGLFTSYSWWSACGLLVIMVGALLTLYRQRVTPSKFLPAICACILLITLVTATNPGI